MGRPTIARELIDRWTVLILLGAGAFMFWGAGHYTIFDDEAFSCQRYVMPVGQMVAALWCGVEPDPPLYYVLESGWVRVFGVGPVGLRSLSILFFLAGLVFIRLAGQAWFDRTTGRVAMLLCALHPAHLFFGFAARWYSLMFLMVAVLLWLTARLSAAEWKERGVESSPTSGGTVNSCGTGVSPVGSQAGPLCHTLVTTDGRAVPQQEFRDRFLIVAWGLTAAGACYTNYFGPVVVGLIWLVGVLRSRRKANGMRRWIWGVLFAVVAYVPWLLPLWKQVTSFPEVGSSWTAYAATAARTLLALLTGNLASVGAWWVWGPMGVFGMGVIVLLVRQWRAVWPMAVVAMGCFTAGVVSRTMIDKYVMTFSGAVCLLVAALLVRGMEIANGNRRILNGQSRVARRRPARRVAHVTLACLIIGWIGCGVNLVTQRHWSSLRWLDPFGEAAVGLLRMEGHHWDGYLLYPLPVMSHPSARYYLARMHADKELKQSRSLEGVQGVLPSVTTDSADWRIAFNNQQTPLRYSMYGALTPGAILPRLSRQKPPPVIATLQTAGFVSLPDWEALQAELDRSYVMTKEHRYLDDPDAAWKDRLDPNVIHPRWRIVVRRWELRD